MSQPFQQRQKPPCRREDALAVLRRLRQAGHVAYFAGGCVRDMLLGLEPKDFDIATDAHPPAIRRLFSNTQAVGAAFGVILVRQGRSLVEVATFRSDASYVDGRHPDAVTFSNAQQDAQRRDFTINGLFLDPLDGNRVIDYVGGQADLAQRRLRAIGDPQRRFAEDHLRMLRAVRFAARFDLIIEPATAAAIAAAAPLLKRISPERVAEELRGMLVPPTRSAAWRWLWEFRLIDAIYRFLPIPLPPALDERRCVFLATAPGATIDFPLALAAASLCVELQSRPELVDLRPLLERREVQRLVGALRQSLRLSNDESDSMRQIIESLGPLLAEEPPTLAARKRFMSRPVSPQARQLLQAIGRIGLHRARIDELTAQLAALENVDCAPAPLISGDDLTAAGLTPGPKFKLILNEVYDQQLEGRIATREAALSLAMELWRK